MNRLERELRSSRASGRKLLVPFFTGNYPDRDTFVALLLEAQAVGADAVEVGIPFSDPSADGPVIQRASECALAGGATVRSILSAVAEARERGLRLPLLYMTYYNPVLAFGPAAFVEAAVSSGADGVLVVDLPTEESAEFAPAARAARLDTVMLVAPTTPDARIRVVLSCCSGFAYCVSVTGVTGEKRPVAKLVGQLVERVRRVTDLPALVGFGVSGPEAARAIAGVADGVIVGSALLQAMGERGGQECVGAAGGFLRGLRSALDS